jgi:hypothetical protein
MNDLGAVPISGRVLSYRSDYRMRNRYILRIHADTTEQTISDAGNRGIRLDGVMLHSNASTNTAHECRDLPHEV